ncbi:MAG TPA: lycopene cyclase [Cellulomonadaceae bacterium]|nr:lycopene cyclase [Cellulomonadaceae bacterium]
MSYLGLDAIFVVVAAVVVIVAVRPGLTGRRRSASGPTLVDRRWWLATALTAAGLMILTAVFDTMMIAADLFRYDASALIGVRIGLTPVEDLAWPLVASVLLPALWELLGRARRADGAQSVVRRATEATTHPEGNP